MGRFFFGNAAIGDSLGILGCAPAVPTAVGPSRSVRVRGGDRVRVGEPATGVVGAVLEECPPQLPSPTASQRHPIR